MLDQNSLFSSSLFQTPADIDRLKCHVQTVALAQGRRVGSPGHKVVADSIQRLLQAMGAMPYRNAQFDLSYSLGGQNFTNVIGKISGKQCETRPPILIGAHYDSSIDGACADDNAAAVAIALLVAETLAQSGGLMRDLVVAFFDAEEPPYFQTPQMGSEYFVKHQMISDGFHAALIMDLVGHDVKILPGMENFLFVTGAESHPSMRKVVAGSQPDALTVLPLLNSYVGDMSDHGAFRDRGIPYLFLSCGQWEHYHRPTDTPDRLNYDKMAAIAGMVHEYLHTMDAQDFRPKRRLFKTDDTLTLELEAINRAFGSELNPLLQLLGISHLKTRKNLTQLVGAMMELGLNRE